MKPDFLDTAKSANPSAIPLPEGKRPWKALGMLRRLDFNRTPGYYFDSSLVRDNDPVLEGCMRMMQLQPGLSIHGTEVMDLHSMRSRVNIKAGLRIVIALSGEIDVRIGGQRIHLHAEGTSSQINAAIINMPEDALFERRWQRGKWERKLALYVSPDWLLNNGWFNDDPRLSVAWPAKAGRVSRLSLPDTLCILPWAPSSHALALAEQLLCHQDDPEDDLSRLRLTSRALELLYEALASLRIHEGKTAGTKSSLRQRDQDRMLKLRNFIDAEIQQPSVQPMQIEELGKRFGLSVSGLQRQFRSAFGTSISEYRRLMRLHQAHTALEQGMSISQAAYLAGYTSTSNFATAFRRQFGISPKCISLRL
ncbi:MAG: helix-turn-helix transcriptional regulator [Alcaligenaceae bacterium]|nr:helix-turn-helix transcriptional regulator [Alcaligenaceae bacterium]